MHTRQGVDAVPAQSQDSAGSKRSQWVPQPDHKIFEWYENRMQEGLSKVYREDVAQRQRIIEVIREMEDANLFWVLYAKYQDARDAAQDDIAKEEVLMALLARIYIAGSLRGCAVIDL